MTKFVVRPSKTRGAPHGINNPIIIDCEDDLATREFFISRIKDLEEWMGSLLPLPSPKLLEYVVEDIKLFGVWVTAYDPSCPDIFTLNIDHFDDYPPKNNVEKYMSSTKLGFVLIPKELVISKSILALEQIEVSKKTCQDRLIAYYMTPQKGFFGFMKKPKAKNREEAIALIANDDFASEEYWFTSSEFVGTKQDSLQKLINVAKNIPAAVKEMELSIEVANWLYLE